MANKNYMKRTFGDFSQRIQEKNETSGGGSVIVDSLPANGVEGQTYLLRKTTEIPGKKAMKFDRVYIQIGRARGSSNPPVLLISDTYTGDDLRREFKEKLNFNEAEWINISDEFDPGNYVFPTLKENIMLNNPAVAIVENESEIASLDFDTIESVYQKIENITLNDFCGLQLSDIGSFPVIVCTLKRLIPTNSFNSLSMKSENINGTFVESRRKLIVNGLSGKLTPEFEEWQDYEAGHIEGTLTNAYSDDRQYFQDLVDEEKQYYGYLILIDDHDEPSTYEYSYTEYVFDKGVYTEIGSNNDSNNGATIGDNFLLGASFVAEKLVTLSATEIDHKRRISYFGNFKFDVYNFMTKHIKHDTEQLSISFSTTLSFPNPLVLTVKLEVDGNDDDVLGISIEDIYQGTERFHQTYPLSETPENLLQVMKTFEFTDEELETLCQTMCETISYFSETGPNEGARNIMFTTRDGNAPELSGRGGVINLTVNDVFCDLFRLNKVESNYNELDQFINE